MTTRISGILIDGFGEPITNAQMRAVSLETGESVVGSTAYTRTGVDGSYDFTLEIGSYSFSIWLGSLGYQYVGNISVHENTPDCALDDILSLPSNVQPIALTKILQALVDAQNAAESAQNAAESAAEDTRKNLIPLSRQYMTLSEAQADIANIPVGSATYVRSASGNVLADEYINVSGTLTATGRSMPSNAIVSKLASLVGLSDTTIFATMTELNDEYDYVMLDGQYNILMGTKGALFDFSGISINGVAFDPSGVLEAAVKDNLLRLSDTTSFSGPSGQYELNQTPYVILSEDFFVLFDLEDYNERSELWQIAYENSLLPTRVNPYAPFSQLDNAGKSQIRVFDTASNGEIAVTSGSSNETNPRPEALDRIVWTSDRNDGAPGGLYYAKAPDFKPYPYISKSKIVGWGHSFMENGRFLNRIAQLTGLYTYNFGRSSLTSEGIASRQGGARTSYVPVSGVIPESGSVNLSPSIPGPNRAYANGAITSIACSFAGVDGMFGWDGTSATFTRTASGAAVSVASPLPIMVYPITGYAVTGGASGGTRYDMHDECIVLIWAGRNNISEVDRVISNVQSMVDYLKPLGKRFVILPEFPSGTEPTGSTNNNYVKAVNGLYKARFPENYCEIDGVDLLANFMNHHNPAFAGDVEDVANGVTPRSLRYDSLHPSQSIAGSTSPENALYIGADVNAEFVYNFMKLKGWVL
nr:MAG TPA: tail spike [Caudoviricetes sp.]